MATKFKIGDNVKVLSFDECVKNFPQYVTNEDEELYICDIPKKEWPLCIGTIDDGGYNDYSTNDYYIDFGKESWIIPSELLEKA